jgi:hypothetical protein
VIIANTGMIITIIIITTIVIMITITVTRCGGNQPA